MKKYHIITLVIVLLFSSCKDNALFEQEMYKNVVALISSDYHNTFEEVVPLTGDEVIGYIAASVGGTDATMQDIVISLEENSEPLQVYNRSLYDEEERLYAKLLPSDKYTIDDYQIQINAGERTGRTMVRLRPDGLSPDSTYFISLKAVDIAGVEINAKKNTILYQVIIANEYASQTNGDQYSMSGMIDGIVTAGNKTLFPLTKNSVRVVAGSEAFESTVADINRTAIVLIVNEDNTVRIEPYGDIEVNQLDNDPSYPNRFHKETVFGRTYNSFLLSYAYTLDGRTRVMKEELRVEVGD
ncbi:BT_3044 domain-containing protein [Sphingobacterium sp. SGR-19]|uniref:BT_3044 domain-containing protein n=1 Tax=Sphingobacterium sp. SGR-19 TaxID=2710886 RepID=UPI0013EA6EEF|nr:DUF4361 domain-containing protein [Sphingobacterium sp. SGR-19]NGM66471.1 DUF4361 domain-containing protein [Sphingobacterium sp. SGR-19]